MPLGNQKKFHWSLLLSFLAPFLFLGVCFVAEGIHPFGDKQILVTDFWHQYYPFLKLLHEKLQSGESLFYTWDSGLGSNFWAMMAYYAASSLNVLTLLVPDAFLRDATALLVCARAGFGGLFFALFLRGTFHCENLSLAFFGTMYALSSFFLGYYWNIIWLDTVALLPLVILGLVRLVRDGKYRLYPISLALALFSNYYIGLFVCIFSVLAFFCLCLFYVPARQIFWQCLRMLAFSLLGGALAAIMLLPAFYALQLTFSVRNVFPTTVEFYESWRAILASLISFHEPTTKTGLPNLSCGVLPLVLFGPFLRARSIRLREKIAAVLLLSFLIFSCNCNILNYMWHGFHFTNMLPYRFSFLFSFVLLTMGYRAYDLIQKERFTTWDILAMLVLTAAVFFVSYTVQENQAVYWSVALAFLYTFIILLYCRKILNKNLFLLSLAIVLGFEMFENTRIGTRAVSTSDYASYPPVYETVETLLQEIDDEEDDLFYRAELSTTYTLNDPALYGYHGLSQFSSMANVHVTEWLKALGVAASEAGNRYFYSGGTPVVNMFTGINYLLCRAGPSVDKLNWEELTTEEGVYAYKSRYSMPIGFWTNSALAGYAPSTNQNPFQAQNDLFSLATGIDTPLFEAVAVTSVSGSGIVARETGYGSYSYTAEQAGSTRTCVFSCEIEEDCSLYGYAQATDGNYVAAQLDGNTRARYLVNSQPYVFPLGEYTAGDTAGVSMDITDEANHGSITVLLYKLNQDVLDTGYEILSEGGLTLTACSDTHLEGTMMCQRDGLCYFSIPYEAGWSASVDGAAVETVAIDGGMLAVPVSVGSHTIVLNYTPRGFAAGAGLTLCAVGVLVVLYLWEKRRARPLLRPAGPQKAERRTLAAIEESLSILDLQDDPPQNDNPEEDACGT